VLFWHVGATVSFVRYAFRDAAMDLRFLALGAVLPDLIDTPIAAAMWSSWQAPRLVAHSLLFGSAAMVLVLVITRRGTRRKQGMLVAVGVLMHLTLDGMWADPETLWWPFLGWEFTRSVSASMAGYALTVISNPWIWVGEVIGLGYLVSLWRKSGLSESAARRDLVSTGRVSAPIGRNGL